MALERNTKQDREVWLSVIVLGPAGLIALNVLEGAVAVGLATWWVSAAGFLPVVVWAYWLTWVYTSVRLHRRRRRLVRLLAGIDEERRLTI